MLLDQRVCISDKWRSGLSCCNFSSSLVPLLGEVKDRLGSRKAEREFLRENYFCVSPVIKDLFKLLKILRFLQFNIFFCSNYNWW